MPEWLSSSALLRRPRVSLVRIMAGTQHCSSGRPEAVSHIAQPKGPKTRIYNYVLGGFGEKKEEKFLNLSKKKGNDYRKERCSLGRGRLSMRLCPRCWFWILKPNQRCLQNWRVIYTYVVFTSKSINSGLQRLANIYCFKIKE